MSVQAYEDKMRMLDVYAKLVEAENDIRAGHVKDAQESLDSLRRKYNV